MGSILSTRRILVAMVKQSDARQVVQDAKVTWMKKMLTRMMNWLELADGSGWGGRDIWETLESVMVFGHLRRLAGGPDGVL